MRTAAALGLVLAAAAAQAAPAPKAAETGSDDTPTQLEPVQVYPQVDLFDGLAKLRKTLCSVGCEGGVIKPQESVTTRVLEYVLLPAAPKPPEDYDLIQRDLRCHEMPGLGQQC